MDLNDMEMDALRCSANLPQDTFKSWGAGLGACIEFLYGSGYLTRKAGAYTPTDKGWAALGQTPKRQEPNV